MRQSGHEREGGRGEGGEGGRGGRGGGGYRQAGARACECALPAATVLERCIRSRGRVHDGAALSGERRILRRKLRTFCLEVWFSQIAERRGTPALFTPGDSSDGISGARGMSVRQVACRMLHSISGVWPVHVVRSVTIRASALAGMTAVKGHGKCRCTPRRMTSAVLLDTWHVADVYPTWHVAQHVQLHDLRMEWTAEVLGE